MSNNNFPTAAGLASSASGFAALVYTLAQLYQLPATPSELSRVARQGSGSACRSLFGGFVAWEMGQVAASEAEEHGDDSLAVQVADRDHWPDLQALICVVSDLKKTTSSTTGMQRTVQTSTLLQHRIKHVVPQRMADMTAAIQAKDFDRFAQLTMQDSNSFHAVCLDTSPPIFYMNDVSRSIILLVEELNRASLANGQGYKAAYTFDAGPNAVLYARQADMPQLRALVQKHFPTSSSPASTSTSTSSESANPLPPKGFNPDFVPAWPAGSVRNLILTSVGDGPRVLPASASLINEQGLPKTLA